MSQAGRKPWAISRHTLSWLCVALLVGSLLPIYGLAFYNHPFYDDFGFSLLTRQAWQETSTLGGVVEAAWRNTQGIRFTWQGMYTPSFLSAMQPGVFGEGYYWLTTFLLLSFLLLSLWFSLSQWLRRGLGADRATCRIVYCGLAFLMVHFVPDVSEAFFWYNGGVGYTGMWSLMLLSAGLWFRLQQTRARGRGALLYGLLLVLMVLLGGGGYPMLVLCSLCALLYTLWAFVGRRPKRWLFLSLTAMLLGCFAFNMMAPGNLVRAKTLEGGMGAAMAVLQALYFGLGLMGHWFSLPLAGVLLLALWLLYPALKKSPYPFAHPLRASVLGMGLFCAQLAPTLFTGNYLGDGRVMDTYYYTYVLLALLLALYWEGWALRRGVLRQLVAKAPGGAGKGAGATVPAGQASAGVGGGLLALVTVLLAIGCLCYHPDGSESYGPQNTAGGSAALSLLRGEAQQYHREMSAREALLNDPSQQEVSLQPISSIPKAFMGDALDSASLDYVLSLYGEYYSKQAVTAQKKE